MNITKSTRLECLKLCDGNVARAIRMMHFIENGTDVPVSATKLIDVDTTGFSNQTHGG